MEDAQIDAMLHECGLGAEVDAYPKRLPWPFPRPYLVQSIAQPKAEKHIAPDEESAGNCSRQAAQ